MKVKRMLSHPKEHLSSVVLLMQIQTPPSGISPIVAHFAGEELRHREAAWTSWQIRRHLQPSCKVLCNDPKNQFWLLLVLWSLFVAPRHQQPGAEEAWKHCSGASMNVCFWCLCDCLCFRISKDYRMCPMAKHINFYCKLFLLISDI